MTALMKNIFPEESAQGLTEYSLILAFIALAAYVALSELGKYVQAPYQNVSNALK